MCDDRAEAPGHELRSPLSLFRLKNLSKDTPGGKTARGRVMAWSHLSSGERVYLKLQPQ